MASGQAGPPSTPDPPGGPAAVPPAPAPTVLSQAVLAACERGDTLATLALFDQEGYLSIDTRSLYQSTLLHTAAKRGHVEVARQLLARGAQVNCLDYGGIRRSPLHWACHGGHVAMVEILLEAGADTTADGRSWSKLVQGQRCGSLIPKDQPTESVESVCRNNAVRLALTRPDWSPSLNGMWPQRFKEAAQTLLLASACSRSCCEEASGCSSGSPRGGGLPLGRDTLLEVLQRAAYPISAWM
ncbi:hypothetical protein CHLNCDRAFT_136398 [Chlorella variabilis]|uniref:Uncharacterized protein n=1 Tax=Chlorella variabilis TaxID=554065 RepID=E1ZK99_CHLVA|nr:hypothetical protein CHLNCDRAFT_136398 [Chlorella variabilis]EFN53656.1 hypothetical protein CHLNCDRAFT_136398 [Chlorella variabilis]|eukprot:XP_005845758.1 hypothetical protein CHLNCDRAFT_136398 [Chlorella variabilis]